MDLRLTHPLRELLQRAIGGDYTRGQLAELHTLVYALGRRYVRMRCAAGKIPLSLLGLGEADVVHDCIAELFTRSESGELVEITRYFEYRHVNPASLPEDMLVVHLRNLVFSVVGDNVFRMLNEADPALGKIIRNVKLAVQRSDRWTLETRFDEKVLVLACADGTRARPGRPQDPPLPDDRLEAAVFAALSRHPDIPVMMDELACELVRSGVTTGVVPLLSLAVMVKAGYGSRHAAGAAQEQPESPMITEELKAAISEACSSVGDAMRTKYVGRGKVCADTFTQYLAALEKYLVEEYVVNPGPRPAGSTYFEYLRELRPQMTREEYAGDHRPVLEYLAKLVRHDLREKIGGA